MKLFAWRCSCVQARTVVRDTRLYHDSEQVCELQSTAPFGLTTTLRCTCLSYMRSHVFSPNDKIWLPYNAFSEFPPNPRHFLSVLAYILLFPVFHLFADLCSCFILDDFAFLIMETCLPYYFEGPLSFCRL